MDTLPRFNQNNRVNSGNNRQIKEERIGTMPK
jgi:hypothetical protein